MKKNYAVNTKTTICSDDWNTADMADWFETYEEAFSAAEKAFEEPDVTETVLTIFEDGEVAGTPLHMVLEDGDIHQYQNGMRLWA